jgi:hypothetical protein
VLATALALLAAATGAAPAAPPPPAPHVLQLQRPAGGEWMGLYLLGRRAGSSFAALAEDTWEGAPAVRSDATVTLSAVVGGAAVKRTFEEHRFYERRDGGRLLAFKARRGGDGGDELVSGSCDGTRCRVTLEHGGGTEQRLLPDPGETLAYADPVRLVAAQGGELVTPFLDLEKLEVRTLRTRLLERTTRNIEGVPVAVARIGSRDGTEALESVSVLATQGGRILELAMGSAMRGVAETEAAGRSAAPPTVDLFALTRVELPAPVEPGVRELSLVVSGLPPEFRHADERQSFQDLGGGKVRITIRAHGPAGGAVVPADLRSFAADLQPTPAIDFDSPEVRELQAHLLPGPEGDAWQRAGVLLSWVHGTLQKVYGKSSDRASRVVRERRGDCTEHALLFTALARASGIPARLVHGLVATGDEDGRALFWHEWAEIRVGGAWVAVDPTFGQAVADATHLELGQGDDASTVTLLGQIRVLDVKPR